MKGNHWNGGGGAWERKVHRNTLATGAAPQHSVPMIVLFHTHMLTHSLKM